MWLRSRGEHVRLGGCLAPETRICAVVTFALIPSPPRKPLIFVIIILSYLVRAPNAFTAMLPSRPVQKTTGDEKLLTHLGPGLRVEDDVCRRRKFT